MKCVVFFSGGLSSWAAAKRAVAKYGAASTTLLFTDTLIEDPDLYRFLDDAAANVGAPLMKIHEGRTPWKVFRDEKFIGNTRKDPCSKLLKRELGLWWVRTFFDPADTVLVFGIGFDEPERFDNGAGRGILHRYAKVGWRAEAPLLQEPWLRQQDIRALAEAAGLRVPRLYTMGFTHNNCGGFCVKAGQAHFARLLDKLPDVYATHEAEEAAFNAARPGRPVRTVLRARKRVRGQEVTQPLTLKRFREHVQSGGVFDKFDVGGCDCFGAAS